MLFIKPSHVQPLSCLSFRNGKMSDYTKRQNSLQRYARALTITIPFEGKGYYTIKLTIEIAAILTSNTHTPQTWHSYQPHQLDRISSLSESDN